jgi:hypothetical protein
LVNIRELSDDELVVLVDAKYHVEHSASAYSSSEVTEAAQALEDYEQQWAQVSDRLVALTGTEIPKWRRTDARRRDDEVRARRVELVAAYQQVTLAARKLQRLEASATDPTKLAAAREQALADGEAALAEQRRRERRGRGQAGPSRGREGAPVVLSL